MRALVRFGLLLGTLLTLIALVAAVDGPSGVSRASDAITQLTFRWSYQPNGSTNFTTGTTSGTASVRLKDGINLATGDSFGVQSDIYYCDPHCGGAGVIQGFWSNNGDGGVHDLGAVAFESVTNAPDKSMGLGEFQFYNNQGVLAQVGHVYAIVTGDGNHYGKLVLDSIEPAPLIVQGDVDCSGGVTTRDVLAILAHLAETTPIAQTESCPEIASGYYQYEGHYWGDTDCSGDVGPADILAQLAYVASLDLNQLIPCRAIGTEFPFEF